MKSRTNYKKLATDMAEMIITNVNILESEVKEINKNNNYDQSFRYPQLYDRTSEKLYRSLGAILFYVNEYHLPVKIKHASNGNC